MNNKGKAIFIGAEEEENLAIRYLGAVLKNKGHDVLIIPYSTYDNPHNVVDRIKSFNPDLLAVSMAFQSLAIKYLELCEEIKNSYPDTHLTIGGHFPTFEYEKLMEFRFIDSIIRFEGEEPILMLMDAVLNHQSFSNIPQLVYRENNEVKENPFLNQFPILDHLPYPMRNKKPQLRLGEMFGTLITSRGCVHSNCVYCCIGAFHSSKKGHKYVLRSMKDVAREMKILYDQGVRLFQFHDDNFLLSSLEESLVRLKSLKKSLEEEKLITQEISLLIKTRPDALNDKIMTILGELGTIGIFLGVENASDSGLRSLGRGNTINEVEQSLKLIKNHEMAVTFNLLMFHPRANLEEINQNIYFMKDRKSVV
jgi:anaerobic magnesium-protoporphyrin IX monomethyl ester cyclase